MPYFLSGGATLGGSAASTDVIGFYGATPVAQAAATAQSAINTTVITTVSSTSLTTLDLTKINALIARVEEIRVYVAQTRADLIAYGLQKGSI